MRVRGASRRGAGAGERRGALHHRSHGEAASPIPVRLQGLRRRASAQRRSLQDPHSPGRHASRALLTPNCARIDPNCANNEPSCAGCWPRLSRRWAQCAGLKPCSSGCEALGACARPAHTRARALQRRVRARHRRVKPLTARARGLGERKRRLRAASDQSKRARRCCRTRSREVNACCAVQAVYWPSLRCCGLLGRLCVLRFRAGTAAAAGEPHADQVVAT